MDRLLTIPAPCSGGPASARVRVRDEGEGPAVVLLHGGWGYQAYPFDGAFEALSGRHRVIAPDRVGYGRSDPLPALERGFHQRMARETLAVLDALGIERAAFWGHSDGAVVAGWIGILAPERTRALVLEALHFVAAKRRSVEFFESSLTAPERFGPAIVSALERDHGARWREVLAAGGRAWLEIIREGEAGRPDLYDGRLGELRMPILLLHGRHDPRTEPGELEAALRAVPHARLEVLEAGHCPHASVTAGVRAVELAAGFLAEHRGR
jgi:pimeloyl-ACP methyl ester carboxylesterase